MCVRGGDQVVENIYIMYKEKTNSYILKKTLQINRKCEKKVLKSQNGHSMKGAQHLK